MLSRRDFLAHFGGVAVASAAVAALPEALRTHGWWSTAYAEDTVVFVDPATHDFLGLTETYVDSGSTGTVVVRSAGAATTIDEPPALANRSVTP